MTSRDSTRLRITNYVTGRVPFRLWLSRTLCKYLSITLTCQSVIQ